jgi:hypothetical protein
MKISIQCESMGQRCGINTYATRIKNYLNKIDDVEADMFVEKIRGEEPDIISIQYEPGMLHPQKLASLLQNYSQPVVVTAHHTIGLSQLYPMLDGIVLHDEGQIEGQEKPWDYKVIPHPALVFEKKDKEKLREKYNLPKDKKIIGTMGFICGTGKMLPLIVQEILKNIKDDEFLYLITSFWKGGDMGRMEQIMDIVKAMGKEDNFRIDADFVKEETLNEKMQACDLLYSWSQQNNNQPGSQSGSAADMYGSGVKLIVKDVPHYSFIGKQDKVEIGRQKPKEFVEDLFNVLRNKDLEDTQDPTWLSWEEKIKEYLDYFKELSL